eukprot:Gregarina_sp_Poly_1__9735@NODE_61_length_16710_cov_172_464520_g52_i0_p3_GENE_NODE_61_length_16710_cov_172_464520_g52_i0NODE_61_length_16710_cov_172_464520_g52_i0_p3_ORF_typecomplete_len974_score148_22GYF/PF02213_16/5_3e10_NODE_61_length_16710_cov_172_464520_g52_i08853806
MQPPTQQNDIIRKYTAEQLLSCYRRYACPEGVEQHTAIYSHGTLLPERLAPEPNYFQVLSTAQRTKRQISDLATRPQTNSRLPREQQVLHKQPGPGNNGPGNRAGRGVRSWITEDEGQRPRPDSGWPAHDLASERFAGMQTWAETGASRASTSRAPGGGRGLLANGQLPRNQIDPDWGALRSGTQAAPHTAASWEKLAQKISSSPSKIASLVVGKDLRNDLSNNTSAQPPPAAVGEGGGEPPSLPADQEPAWMTEIRRRFPNGLPEPLLQTLLGNAEPTLPPQVSPAVNLAFTDSGSTAPDGRPPDRAAFQPGGSLRESSLRETGLRETRLRESGPRDSGLNFKDLLHQAHGGSMPPASGSSQASGVVAASGLSVGEGPVIARVVRWSDNRPLYVVESTARAEGLSQERTNARHIVEYATDQYEARIILENYETHVARLYQELLEVRRLWLPTPLAEYLRIDESTSIALWPSFRELFSASQAEGMSRQLQTWEARLVAAQQRMPSPQMPSAPPPKVSQIISPLTSSVDPPPTSPLVRRWGSTSPTAVQPGPYQRTAGPEPRAPLPVSSDRAVSPPVVPVEDPSQSVQDLWGADPDTITWWYLDPHQTVRGPYGSQKMFDWWQKNYFPPDLPIRFSPSAGFVPLSSLYPPELQGRHKPFMSRPPLLPQKAAPPTSSQQVSPIMAPQQTQSQQQQYASRPTPATQQSQHQQQEMLQHFDTESMSTKSTHQPASTIKSHPVAPKKEEIPKPAPQTRTLYTTAPSVEDTKQSDVRQMESLWESSGFTAPQVAMLQQSLKSSPQPQSTPAPEGESPSAGSNAQNASPLTQNFAADHSSTSSAVVAPTITQAAPPTQKAFPKRKAAVGPMQAERPQAFVQKHDKPALQPVVERPSQSLPWARKKPQNTLEADVDSSDDPAIGPSLDESRFQNVAARGSTTPNVGVAKAGSKKLKPKAKKQSLLEILTDQQSEVLASLYK